MRGLLFPINSYLPPNWCHWRCLQLDTVPCSWYGCFLILGFADLRDTLIRLHSQECHSSAIKETVPEPPGVVGISCKHKPPDGFLWKCATQWYTPKWPSYPSGENNDQPSNSEIPQKKDKPRASQCDSYQVGQQIWASHVSGVCCMQSSWILLPTSGTGAWHLPFPWLVLNAENSTRCSQRYSLVGAPANYV